MYGWYGMDGANIVCIIFVLYQQNKTAAYFRIKREKEEREEKKGVGLG